MSFRKWTLTDLTSKFQLTLETKIAIYKLDTSHNMSVLLETSVGDIVLDLFVDLAPKTCQK
jgi:hypothetical protein